MRARTRRRHDGLGVLQLGLCACAASVRVRGYHASQSAGHRTAMGTALPVKWR
jgi:hypothetical protein